LAVYIIVSVTHGHTDIKFLEIFCFSVSRISDKKRHISLKSAKNTGCFTLRPIYIYDNISLNSYENEKFVGKFCEESESTHFLFSNSVWKLAVCEIMWKITVKPDRPKMTIMRIRIACWITNATNIHSEYEIFTPLPPLKWLHERASILRYRYMVYILFFTLSHKLKDFRKKLLNLKRVF